MQPPFYIKNTNLVLVILSVLVTVENRTWQARINRENLIRKIWEVMFNFLMLNFLSYICKLKMYTVLFVRFNFSIKLKMYTDLFTVHTLTFLLRTAFQHV